MVVDNALSQESYSAVISNWPAATCFQAYSETGRVPVGPYDLRKVFVLSDERIETLDASKRKFWQSFRDEIAGDHLLEHYLGKLRSTISSTELTIIERNGLSIDALLISDQHGYKLPPHTDAPYKLFTFILYCGELVESRELGTVLYRPLDQGLAKAQEIHHDPSLFRVVKVVDYRSNRGLYFQRTNLSFHGVEHRSPSFVERSLIMITGYIGGPPSRFMV